MAATSAVFSIDIINTFVWASQLCVAGRGWENNGVELVGQLDPCSSLHNLADVLLDLLLADCSVEYFVGVDAVPDAHQLRRLPVLDHQCCFEVGQPGRVEKPEGLALVLLH